MAQGLSRTEIARALHINRNSLKDFLELREIEPDLPNGRYSEELTQKIITLRNQSKRAKNVTTQEITKITIGFEEGNISLDERAVQIRQCARDLTRNFIAIGLHLVEAKKELPHGNWSTWLEQEFDWTQQTANRFMRVAMRFCKLNNVVQFQSSTLQAMLALPEGDEQNFIDAQEAAGKPVNKMSAREVQSAVKNWKQRAATSDIDSEQASTSAGVDNSSTAQFVVPPVDELAQLKQPVIEQLKVLLTLVKTTTDRETVAAIGDALKKISPSGQKG